MSPRVVPPRLRHAALTTRLAAVAALAVAVAIGLVVAVALVVVRAELRGGIDEQLRRQATQLHGELIDHGALDRDDLPQPDTRPGQARGWVQLIDTHGGAVRPADQDDELPVTALDRAVAAGTRHEALHDSQIGSVDIRVLTVPTARTGEALQLALPLATIEEQTQHLVAAFALLALAGLLVAVVLARAVAGRAIAPMRRLTDAAELITATRDLGHRIDDEGRRDELGRLATSFNTMLDALQASVSAQRQLVADASHELRTPLSSLRTNVEVLRRVDELAPAARGELVDAVVDQLTELNALVTDVVELARGEEPSSALEEVRLDRIVEHAVIRARRHWPGVAFDVRTAPAVVRAAPARLDRAVANLLDNAAKFSSDRPEPRVRVDVGDDGRLTVADSGPGVPEADLPHVFERFYRATEARGMPGSGLGLAIVAQVARTHGGQVSLRNAPDGGAIAELAMPVLDAEPAD